MDFENDSYISGQAKRVWDKLVRKGVAEEVEPAEEAHPGSEVYQGYYRIKAPRNDQAPVAHDAKESESSDTSHSH